MSEYLFEINGWSCKTVEKTKNKAGSKLLLSHCCCADIMGRIGARFAFYYVSKSTTLCPFCEKKIPDEITFLLEMIKNE